jgi:O-antigen/teichoic acid export membrane protein
VDADQPKSIPIREGIAWTSVGNGVYLASQYAMLMVIAKMGSPTLVGQFSLAMAIAAPIFIFSQMQLRQAQVTDAKNEFCFADYFWCRTFSSLLALFAVGFVIVCSGYSGEMAWLIALIGISKAFESVSDIAYGSMQRHERLDLVAISMMLKGPLSAIVLAVSLRLGSGLVCAFAGVVIVWGAVFCFFDIPMQARFGKTDATAKGVRIIAIRRLVVTAFPLALAGGLNSLLGNTPRYILEAQRGKEAVALFSVAAAPLALLSLLSGAIGQASLSRVAEYFQHGKYDAFNRLNLKVSALQLLIASGFTAIVAIWGDKLIELMFTREYKGAVPILVIMSASAALGSVGAYGSTILAASRAFRLQLVNVIVAMAVQIPACIYFIKQYGPVGAGWADLAKNAAAVVVLSIAGYAIVSREFPRLKPAAKEQSVA